ncbi:hypothetical protein KP509_13G006900 [Ceratopteris richardii]|uniref:mRNA cap guanine-N(7) methyltransferase n=1 Tax=Ceratopteris richardii TaxID=49495 RepID=A0A8T2TID2_CERRI|nr:hypothetical protein KP509_13G006900 [Ceratopteris richardii]KAH7420420.1 hypothetical protein KP509_13G006900 [Ceratopteris richardii]
MIWYQAAPLSDASSCSSSSSSSAEGNIEGYEQYVIARHYRERCNRTLQQREASPIIHLKKLHDWIKENLIRMCTCKGDKVIDIACGKGSDIPKWHKVEARLYIGVDIVESSLQQARKRYNEVTTMSPGRALTTHNNSSYVRRWGHHPTQRGYQNSSDTKTAGTKSFAARFLCADCFTHSLRARVAAEAPEGAVGSFDVCSCQFALHYAWCSAGRARATLASVAGLLKPGGFFFGTIPDSEVILSRLRSSPTAFSGQFGNKIYRIKFDATQRAKALRCWEEPYGIQYEFHLLDAVDHCPEWLVPFQELQNLAHEYGFELLLRKNFQEFVREHMQAPNLAKLMHKLGAPGNISQEEWECVSIYLVFIFRKRG